MDLYNTKYKLLLTSFILTNNAVKHCSAILLTITQAFTIIGQVKYNIALISALKTLKHMLCRFL
jgi:hypothetical protein